MQFVVCGLNATCLFGHFQVLFVKTPTGNFPFMLILVAPVDNPYHHHQDVYPCPVLKILIWLTHACVECE